MNTDEENSSRQVQTEQGEDDEIGYDINTGSQTSVNLLIKRRKRLIMLLLLLIFVYIFVFYFSFSNNSSGKESSKSNNNMNSENDENSDVQKIDINHSSKDNEASKLYNEYNNNSSNENSQLQDTSSSITDETSTSSNNENIKKTETEVSSETNETSHQSDSTSSITEEDKFKKLLNENEIIQQTNDYKVYRRFHRSALDFTQGLFFDSDNTLVESTGMYKRSVLKKYDFDNPDKIHWEIKLNDKYFGEGACIVEDSIFQLTWKERVILKYKYLEDSSTTASQESAPLLNEIITADVKIAEGYGIAWDFKNTIYVADSTDEIKIIETNDKDMKVIGKLPVTENGKKIKKVNELEFVNGKIWANIWLTNHIVVIDPLSGKVEKRIDLSYLVEYETKHIKRNSDMDVLNGIAYNAKGDFFVVTGKYWSGIYVVKFNHK